VNILYVTPYVPSPIRTRPYNLIQALICMGHQITLVTAASTSAEAPKQADELRSWGVAVEVFQVPLLRSLCNCLRALPASEPLQAAYAYHPAMEKRLGQLLQTEAVDVVHIEHLRAARLVQAVRGTPAVYDSVDCISLLFEQAAQKGVQLRSRAMAAADLARTRRYEARLQAQYDHVVVSSRRDKEALETLARRYLPPQTQPAPITVVTNGVDLEYFAPPAAAEQRDERTIVFTGKMSYHANVTGVLLLAKRVLPRVWNQDAQVVLQIVGKDPPAAVRQLAKDRRIVVTGYVDDLRPYLTRAKVAVCTVPYAAGVQFKVLEAMAMGTPVVCTQAAFAGLEGSEGEIALVGDSADALADHILRIQSDPALGKRLAAAGRRYVEIHHSWEAAARRLVAVYENTCSLGRD